MFSLVRRMFGSSASTAPTKQKVQVIIDENPVAVFSKSYCPYCNATKSTLVEHGAKRMFVVELDQVDDGSEIQTALAELTGQKTVPNVFIGRKHIGGNSDLQAKAGELGELLRVAKAL